MGFGLLRSQSIRRISVGRTTTCAEQHDTVQHWVAVQLVPGRTMASLLWSWRQLAAASKIQRARSAGATSRHHVDNAPTLIDFCMPAAVCARGCTTIVYRI